MNDEKQALVPKLRFPKYVGQRLRKALLKEVTAESGERVGDNFSTMQVMGVSKMEGIVPMEGRLISSDISRYKIVRKNWFAYNPMRLNIGSIARWKGEQNILVSPDYVVFKCLNGADLQIDPEYLNHFRQSDVWKQFVTEGGDGSVRVRIYYRDLARLQLLLPGRDEQQKIADCLSSLDTLIAAQADKLDALKTHKRGLMQQLFPREGEIIPRLRFPEFREAGEWEQTNLEQLVDFRSGGTPSKANPAFWSGSIPWVSAKDMKQLFLDDTEDHISTVAVDDGAKMASPGTLLMLTRGMTLLKDVPICVLQRGMSFNQDVKALRPKKDMDGLFLAFSLLANLHRLLKMVDIAGHGTGKLNTDELKLFELVRPQSDEQQKIADCFSSIDALIVAQADKLDALKTHKKGLMQQLFPSPEA
ncbi:MAG TPA: restriction endonuclease subunit S [Candidatus Competibacter sp.]|nr:restriction endonuclease subunit S [Candidatus Competibacter sp.]